MSKQEVGKQKLFITTQVKGQANDEEMTITGVIGSTGIVDRQGESLNPQGWQLDNYMKNPVILYGHDYRSLPIGKAVRVYMEAKQLLFDIKFAATQMGKEVYQLMKDGILSAVSVGFIPLKWDESGEYTWAEMELLELSVVPVPANPEALANVQKSAPTFYKEFIEKKDGEPEPKPAEPVAPIEPVAPVEPENVEQKSGRVLSKKNEDALRSAYEVLGNVLAQLDKDNEKKDGEPVEPAPVEPVAPVEPKKDEPVEDKALQLKKLHGLFVKADQHVGLAIRLLKTIKNQQLAG